MNLDAFLTHVSDELVVMEDVRRDFLDERLSAETRLSFFSDDKNPGFCSPWWEMNQGEYIMTPAEAGKELVIKACANLYMIGGNVINLFTTPFLDLDSENLVSSKIELWCANFVAALYYSVNFVVDLILNLTAIITRSLASIVLGADLALTEVNEQLQKQFTPS